MKFLFVIAFGVATALAIESQLLKEWNDGYNQFTANVYKELTKTNSGNFLVCPLSADVILSLVNDGAAGQTSEELTSGLHLPADKDKIRQIFQELSPHLQGNEEYTLTSANKVFIKHDFSIKDQFKSTAVNVFGAEIENIDFDKADQAASTMNRWVEDKTHNKIKNLISPDDLDAATRAVLINAMYFHGTWVTEFKKQLTQKADFHLVNGDKVKVDMMHQRSRFHYYECSELNAKFLELPYAGDDVTMTFVLPNDKDGLAALEARIGDALGTPKYRVEDVHVNVPKFKIESTIQFLPILEALGISTAFTDGANFSGISEQPIKITKVVQKAFIEVEEEGTTAAAATAVISGLTYSAVSRPAHEPKYFIADHPFIYYLKSSAGIMFIGRYTQK